MVSTNEDLTGTLLELDRYPMYPDEALQLLGLSENV